ncbi:MAG: exo-alpha-sialidase, partial [Veillonellaceae bacterium]|nr:exo-alpha-sialidase [Veillonellaceae bacterium]
MRAQLVSEPDMPSLTITGMTDRTRTWLDKLGNCPVALYVLQRECGPADLFTNYVRGLMVEAAETERTYQNYAHHSEDNATSIKHAFTGSRLTEFVKLRVVSAANGTLGANELHDITGNRSAQCFDTCGKTVQPGDFRVAVSKANTQSTVYYATDGSDVWFAAAAYPFSAGVEAISAAVVDTPTGYRIIVASQASAGKQGLVAISDDLGATWLSVTIGGASAGEGATWGGGLVALDHDHIWLAGANGSIWFSGDAGITWTQQEAGVLTTGSYLAVHFVDENNGMAV